jgi:hypothetical protein
MTDPRSDVPTLEELQAFLHWLASSGWIREADDEKSLRYLASHLPEMLRATEENRALRKLLWLRHHQTTAGLYGDDGEMQCGRCMIDFKRNTAEEIEQRFFAINQPAIAAFFAPSSVQGMIDERARLGKALEDSQADIRAAAREGDAR